MHVYWHFWHLDLFCIAFSRLHVKQFFFCLGRGCIVVLSKHAKLTFVLRGSSKQTLRSKWIHFNSILDYRQHGMASIAQYT